FLEVQVSSGASAVQLFDSWAGILSPDDYRRGVLPYSKQIFSAIAASGVPGIHFGVGTGELLELLGEAGADVVGVDWRAAPGRAGRRGGPGDGPRGRRGPGCAPRAGAGDGGGGGEGPRGGAPRREPYLQPGPRGAS